MKVAFVASLILFGVGGLIGIGKMFAEFEECSRSDREVNSVMWTVMMVALIIAGFCVSAWGLDQLVKLPERL